MKNLLKVISYIISSGRLEESSVYFIDYPWKD